MGFVMFGLSSWACVPAWRKVRGDNELRAERVMNKYSLIVPVLVAVATPALACDLKVDSAWIREAPANATSLAGYAVLKNTGAKALSVVSMQSAAFDKIELHESLTENGVAKMRAIDKLEIAPGGKVEFAPSGKHFMLLNPKPGLRSGDAVAIKIKDAGGCETTVNFKVSSAAANATDSMDHSKMDHSSMDKSKMGQSK